MFKIYKKNIWKNQRFKKFQNFQNSQNIQCFFDFSKVLKCPKFQNCLYSLTFKSYQDFQILQN